MFRISMYKKVQQCQLKSPFFENINQSKNQEKFFIFGPECTIPLEGHEDP